MSKIFKSLAIGGILGAAMLAGSGGEAKAGDYCREYTRTVYIGARAQEAYGTACLQPDGSWMIVGEGLGSDIPDNVSNVNYVIRDNDRYVTPQRVVYYEARPNYYRRPNPVFIWSNNSRHFYRNGHYVNYRKWDRHDRHDYRGRGRGHGHR